MDWQPIETAPKDGTGVLLWVDSVYPISGRNRYVMGRWDTKRNIWDFKNISVWGCSAAVCFSHWMPLPAPPQTDSREG